MNSEPTTLADIHAALRRLEVLAAINGRPRTLLSRGAAAESLGISLAHFDRYVRCELPFVLIGEKKLYRPQDLERWAGSQVQDRTKSARRS